ncbi:hypothetical protein D3C73_973810 [compost metagenome]
MFDCQLFRHRFYHQTAVGQRVKRLCRLNARQQGFGGGGIGLAGRNTLAQPLGESADCLPGSRGGNIKQLHLMPGGGGHLSDTDTHGTGTNHRHSEV